MDKGDKNNFLRIIGRYAILVLIALPGFNFFYYIFSPLTIYPVYGLLNLFYDVNLVGTEIFIGIQPVDIIGACIAGAAYYFLLILNLSTQGIGINKRLKILAFSWGIFLIINILRIFSLSIMYVNGSPLFDLTHKLFWYLGSTVFVVVIWFLAVKLFNIKKIPFYSDIKTLYGKSVFGKK